jgi:hypothetical protein
MMSSPVFFLAIGFGMGYLSYLHIGTTPWTKWLIAIGLGYLAVDLLTFAGITPDALPLS